jgi:hypothetical protein
MPTGPLNEIILIDGARTDSTAVLARAVPSVRVVDERVKGLVVDARPDLRPVAGEETNAARGRIAALRRSAPFFAGHRAEVR